MKRSQKILVASISLAALLWVLPFLRWLVLPLIYLNTHLHELGHALAAMATGGSVGQIRVFADGSGVAAIRGGAMLLIAPAGYVGSAAFGAAMVAMAGTAKGARTALWGLFGMMVFSMIFFVRGDIVGVLSGIVWIFVLYVLATRLPARQVQPVTQFLGAMQCLASVNAFLPLLQLSAYGNLQNDAGIMQQITGIPAMVWAVIWLFLSLILLWMGIRRAWHTQELPPRAPRTR